MGALLELLFVTALAGSDGVNYTPQGIVARTRLSALLFVTAYDCDLPGGLDKAGVVLETRDAGATWKAVFGPMPHAEFRYAARVDSQRLIVLGHLYSTGPTRDPFVMLPDGNGWLTRPIYAGYASVEGASVAGSTIVVWLRHLTLGDDGWDGPIFEHSSNDAGKTWKQGRRAGGVSAGTNAARRIGPSDAGWRAINADNGIALRVERLDEDQQWTEVSRSAWQTCR